MKRGVYAVAVISIVGAAFWLLRSCNRRDDAQITAPVLAPTDSAKVILDPKNHTVTTITRTGPVKQTYLPPHVTSITVGKDGKVTVHARAWGTEASPFVGFGYSDKARLALGVDLLYWHRWELGPFIGTTVSGPLSVRVGVKVSYNVWSNTSLFVGVDTTKSPTGGISFKF